ncbi:MAG TPA: hypothetical protein EYM84_07855 [Flavobacteriales bacterium]|nr:hypothetical protein [Flavobacteriales bacterium]HIN40171.1 hypothetical protein [Flavobacteriales bacterium]
MNGKKTHQGIIFIFLLLSLISCIHTPLAIAPSSTPVDPNNLNVLGHAVGKSSYISVLGFIPLDNPDFNAAIDDALSNYNGGKALINVRSYATTVSFVFFSIHSITIEGDVIGN